MVQIQLGFILLVVGYLSSSAHGCVEIFEHEIDYMGGDLSDGNNVKSNSKEDCREICRKTVECKFWTFVKIWSDNCLLKYSSEGKRRFSGIYGFVSGNVCKGEISSTTTTTATTTTESIVTVICISSEFWCADGAQCIPAGYKCDGKKDCMDASDESDDACKRNPSVCSNYTTLSESWRNLDYDNRPYYNHLFSDKERLSFGRVDVDPYKVYTNLTKKWYRFSGAAGVQLPTSRARRGNKYVLYHSQNKACGSEANAYIISGGHPNPQNGIVTRNLCFRFNYEPYISAGCITSMFDRNRKFPVRIAACEDDDGDYFVYELEPVLSTGSGYCALDQQEIDRGI